VDVPLGDLPQMLDQAITSADTGTRNRALHIALETGEALGYLLLTLTRGVRLIVTRDLIVMPPFGSIGLGSGRSGWRDCQQISWRHAGALCTRAASPL
jgi:hypothetical protein